MEENKVKPERLFALLESISKYVDREIRIYALGGTALTILGIKKSTIDIDINIENQKDYEYICGIFNQIGFEKKGSIRWITQEGLAFDVFHSNKILGTNLLSDCLDRAQYIRSFGELKLYALSLEDIIISKLARGDVRDFEDIKSILKKKNIDVNGLVERYKETMQDSVVANSKQKLLDLIEIKFRKWGLKIDPEIIKVVKKWKP